MIQGKNILQKITILVMAMILLNGCGISGKEQEARVDKTQYQASFLDLFDTVTTILGYAETEEEFEEITDEIYANLEKYHQTN